MVAKDPITGAELPPDTLQRELFSAPRVLVYAIPPITSATFRAASWTANPQHHIFTARLRVLETAVPSPSSPSGEHITVAVLLIDPATDALFAGCPYAHASAMQQASDSSRLFAVRVVGERGQKATLGMGFEEREDAFHFSDALIKARKVLGLDRPTGIGGGSGAAAGPGGKVGSGVGLGGDEGEKKDFSLKEGETITVKIGGRGRRSAAPPTATAGSDQQALFSIKPPPAPGGGGAVVPLLAPPGSSNPLQAPQQIQPADSCFDDEFGDFQ